MYGLSRNPFGQGQPPRYKDEGWCLVNLKLPDGSALIERITSFVSRVVQQGPGRRGLLIVGNYGWGKTHILREVLGTLSDNQLNTFEVSAGGIKSLVAADILKGLVGYPDYQQCVLELAKGERAIGIDEAQFFDDFHRKGEEEYITLMEAFRKIVERLQEQRAKSAIVLNLTRGPFDLLSRRRPDIVDRFEVIQLKDDLSEEEAQNLIAEYLRTARSNDWNSKIKFPEAVAELESGAYQKSVSDPEPSPRKELWPFTVGSVRALQDFWMTTRERKIRTFLDYAHGVLEFARDKELPRIERTPVERRLERHYKIWQQCLQEWKNSGIRKHKILLRGLYRALDQARMVDSELKIEKVFPEVSLTYGGITVRPDIIVEVSNKHIIVEVETSGSLGFGRYERVKQVVDGGYGAGIVQVCTNPLGSISARRVAYRVSKGEKFSEQYLDITDDVNGVLTTGRLVAFAAAEFDDFPSNEAFRKEVRMVLSGSVASDALRMSGVADKILLAAFASAS